MTGSLNPKSSECQSLFRKMFSLFTWAMGLFIGMHFVFAEVIFRVKYGAPKVRSLRETRVNPYRRTPPSCACLCRRRRCCFFFLCVCVCVCVQNTTCFLACWQSCPISAHLPPCSEGPPWAPCSLPPSRVVTSACTCSTRRCRPRPSSCNWCACYAQRCDLGAVVVINGCIWWAQRVLLFVISYEEEVLVMINGYAIDGVVIVFRVQGMRKRCGL